MAIRNLTQGKIRSLPVARSDIDRMYAILQRLDPSLSLDIVSGAQPASGPNRTGSHRHDVDASGVGHTADIVFSRDGQQLMPNQNRDLYRNYIQAAASQFPGMGHYDWGIHVGGGAPAFWGPDRTSATADPAFQAAYNQGRGMAPPSGQPAAFQPALADIVAPTPVATTPFQGNPMASIGLGFIQRAEERREREAEEEQARREALFAQPFGLSGLYT